MCGLLSDRGNRWLQGYWEVVGRLGWGTCLTGSLCQMNGAPSLPIPFFASTGQIGNLDKFSELGLVQGAELTVGLGWYLRTPSIPSWEQGIIGGPFSIP